jgi:hypothetical protein
MFLEVILLCNYEMFTLVLRRCCGCVFFSYVQIELMSKTKSFVSVADHYFHFRTFYLHFQLIAEWAPRNTRNTIFCLFLNISCRISAL